MNSRIMPSDIAAFTRSRRPRAGSTSEDIDRIDLRGLVRSIWRRRWVIMAAVVGCAALVFAIVSQLPPTFSATSKVMLDPRNAQIVTNVEVVEDLQLSEEVVNGEVALLRSNVLIERMIRALDLESLAPIAPDQVASVMSQPEGQAREDALAMAMPGLVWQVRKRQTVFREGDSFVIGIRYETGDPALTADLANATAQTYIVTQIDSRRETTERATAWLRDSVEEMRTSVEEAETAVARYRAESLLTDGGSIDTVTQQLADLNGQLIAASADRVEAEARYSQLESVRESAGYGAVANIVEAPFIAELLTERAELVREEAVWADRYDEDHPERVRLKGALARLDTTLDAEVGRVLAARANDVEIARIREQSLQAAISDMESRVVSISRNALGLRQLEREAAAARQTYESLLSRLTETRTQVQLQQPDARLIENATVPGLPSAPKPKLMSALGGMVGGALGLGLIFFLEMTATTFRLNREVEAETGLPMLASIPVQNWPKGGLMAATEALRNDPYSLYGERVRHLRTALLMRDGQDAARSILLMSSAPGEGKTTTTLALAQMSVLAGKTVIVVDADLRRSEMQRAFRWEMEEDFSDFIRGEAALDRVIYTDPDFGFDFIAATGPQPDAADKLSAAWLSQVVAELKSAYDVVLIDAPALLAVSDALVLAQVVDTRVYLVRWDSTPRRAVADGLAALDEMGLEVAGMAFTMVDPAKSSDPQAHGYAYDHARRD